MEPIKKAIIVIQKRFFKSGEDWGLLWRWSRRGVGWLGLLLVAALWVQPPGILVVPEAPHTVETVNPKVGVHTRLEGEVEEWKMQRTLSMVREMGAPWIVEYFPWAYNEPQPGQYDWTHSDKVIAHARNQGLTVIARLGMVPAWARPDPAVQETTFTYLDPEHYDDFARFVAAFVEHYRGDIAHIIIWNEPNLSYEWGGQKVDPAAYTELLKAAYSAAHAANPDIIVLGGALAPTLEPPESAAGLNDLLYLEQMYDCGAANYFDALAAHAYGLSFAPDTDPAPELLNFRRVELLRALMDRYGDSEKPIYVTEGGWNDHPRWAWAVRPALRARYTLEAYEWVKTQWPWCPMVAFWLFRTPAPLRNYQDYFAFVMPDFRPRPIYGVVQSYTQGQTTIP